jgi:hypothetical protein
MNDIGGIMIHRLTKRAGRANQTKKRKEVIGKNNGSTRFSLKHVKEMGYE